MDGITTTSSTVATDTTQHTPEQSRDQTPDVFQHIRKTFSQTDIRKVYSFHTMLGGGHFGSVRLASAKSDPQLYYAIKSILLSDIKKDILLLEEELAILQKVDHPNIVKFHESYIDHRYVHIVMELCQGGELFDRIIKLKRLTEHHAAQIMRQMLSAVRHLHANGIVHRDLKPENFMLVSQDPDSEIKLIDFGLSKRFLESDQQHHMHTVVGTPFYVAPEVLKGNYTEQCDVWSLGVIMYILLCGYPPFEGEQKNRIFHNILHQQVIFEDKDWSGVSQPCKNLLLAMLSKDPTFRPTADQCLQSVWFLSEQLEHVPLQVHQTLLKRIQDFHIKKRLQLETLTFLVKNNTFDLKLLRQEFRDLDLDNTGMLKLSEIKQAFAGASMSDKDIQVIFDELDLEHNGVINYSEFLAVVVDKRIALAKKNLKLAFHHFEDHEKGLITAESLVECFRREGKNLTQQEVEEIMSQVQHQDKQMISFEEFCRFMQDIIQEHHEQ